MREGLEPLRFYQLDPKTKKHQNSYFLLVVEIIEKYLIIKSFPVFLVSVEIGQNRALPERSSHKIDIRNHTKRILFSDTPLHPLIQKETPGGTFTSTAYT